MALCGRGRYGMLISGPISTFDKPSPYVMQNAAPALRYLPICNNRPPVTLSSPIFLRQGHFPGLNAAVVYSTRFSAISKVTSVSMQEIIREIFLDHVPLVAQANDELAGLLNERL